MTDTDPKLIDITSSRSAWLDGQECECCAETGGGVPATHAVEVKNPGSYFDGTEQALCADCVEICGGTSS